MQTAESVGTPARNIKRFHHANRLLANVNKCYLLASSKTPVNIKISKTEIFNKDKVKLLEIHIEDMTTLTVMSKNM